MAAVPTTTTTRKRVRTEEEMAVKRASIKLQDGDIRGAVRCITSSDKLASLTDDTIAILKSKHPSTPLETGLTGIGFETVNRIGRRHSVCNS